MAEPDTAERVNAEMATMFQKMMDDLRAEFKQQQKGKQPVEEPNTEKLRNESDESSEAEKG